MSLVRGPLFDDEGPGSPAWSTLTRQPQKAELYRVDAQAREAWSALRDLFGPAGAIDLLQRITFLLFKPEAVKRRCLARTLDFMRAAGFTPVALRVFTINRNMAHQVWRYQWNIASVDRLELCTLIAEETQSMLVVFRDDAPEPGLPAAVRLWGLKGSSKARHLESHLLRAVLGLSNRMLGFVHCSDEPADVLREMGIFLAADERLALAREVAAWRDGGISDRLDDAVLRLEQAYRAHSVDAAEVRARLASRPGPPALRALLADIEQGRRRPLSWIRAGFPDLASDDDVRWDFIVLAAELIAHDLPGVSPILDARALPVVRRGWIENVVDA